MTLSKETESHKTHRLKIYPEHFSAVLTGVKRAELRKNDRNYRVGDILHLMETPKGSSSTTGEFVNAVVTHIADVSDWLPGYVLLSIQRESLERRERDKQEPVGYTYNRGINCEIVAADLNTDCPCGIDLYAAPPAPVVPETLLSAMEEVLRISDRQHDAWDKAKAAVSACRATMIKQPSSIQTSDSAASGAEIKKPASNGQSFGNSKQLNSPAVPDGWIMVPKEPTKEMTDAVLGRACFTRDGSGAKYIYQTMLAAAPKQEAISSIQEERSRIRDEMAMGSMLTKHRFKP